MRQKVARLEGNSRSPCNGRLPRVILNKDKANMFRAILSVSWVLMLHSGSPSVQMQLSIRVNSVRIEWEIWGGIICASLRFT